MSKDDEAEYRSVELVYAGRREKASGTGLSHLFYDADGEQLAFGRAPRGAPIGGRFAVRTDDEGGWFVTTAEFLGPGEPLAGFDGDIARWRLEDRAAHTADQTRKAMARARRDDVDFGELTLNEVRDLMRRPAKSAAVLGQVVHYLTRT